jgi:acetoin utilization protein AcuB
MIASNYLSEHIGLRPTDTVEVANELFMQYNVQVLPVIVQNKLSGLLKAADILEESYDCEIADFVKPPDIPFVNADTDIFEMLRNVGSSPFRCVGVVNQSWEFLGLVHMRDIVATFQHTVANQPGAIIVLTIHPRNYSLSELSRLIESNDAKILHLFVQQNKNNEENIDVIIRLNITHVGKILNALERFNYQTTAVYNAEQVDEDIENKFKYLIHYLK